MTDDAKEPIKFLGVEVRNGKRVAVFEIYGILSANEFERFLKKWRHSDLPTHVVFRDGGHLNAGGVEEEKPQ